MIRLSRRVLVRAFVVVVAVAAVAGGAALARTGAPIAVASSDVLGAHQASTERAVQRIYAAGVDQIRRTRGLKLAISDQLAAQIETRYVGELKTLRQSAVQAIGEAYGLRGDAANQYVQQTVARLDAAPAAAPSPSPVMLAPRLYAIVARMSELTAQLADKGTREMTTTEVPQTPRPSPTPSPSPSR